MFFNKAILSKLLLTMLSLLFLSGFTLYAQDYNNGDYHAYFSKDHKIGLIGRFDAGMVLGGYSSGFSVSPITKVAIEPHIRFGNKNVYYTLQLRFSAPMDSKDVYYTHINDYNLEAAIGVGGYLFNNRSLETHKGWSGMLSGVFYMTIASLGKSNIDNLEPSIDNINIGQGRGVFGPELQMRFNYNLNKVFGFTFGFDAGYNFTSMKKLNADTLTQSDHLIHGLSLGLVVGMTFL